MLLVRVTARPNAPIHEGELYHACRELVAAGMLLTSTGVEFHFDFGRAGRTKYLSVDALVEIEVRQSEDPQISQRAERIKAALKEVFPDVVFAVCLKPVYVGWASDSKEPLLQMDTSMTAAIQRARARIATRS